MKKIYFNSVTLWSIPLGGVAFGIYCLLIVLAGIDLDSVWPYAFWAKALLGVFISVIVIPLVWNSYGKYI